MKAFLVETTLDVADRAIVLTTIDLPSFVIRKFLNQKYSMNNIEIDNNLKWHYDGTWECSFVKGTIKETEMIA